MDEARFWKQTPRLYTIALEAKGRAAETEHKLRAWLAWQTASLNAFAYHAPAKMPRLESLTGEAKPTGKQSGEERRALMKAFARRTKREA